MESHRLIKVATAVNMALFLFLLLAMTSSLAAGSGQRRRYYDDDVFAVERRGGSPACRRCALDRDDWSSCSACYRHARLGGARVPYYGFRKRASPPAEDDQDVIVASPDDVIECCEATGNPYR